jgi:ankyrin repeat protein
MRLRWDNPLAIALTQAIQGGDVDSLKRVLTEQPDLANARIENQRGGSRTPLLVTTDWPGFFPNGPIIVGLLVAAGADPDLRTEGRMPETPLHWAASSDDWEVARALIDAGADIEASGASIAGGTTLDNAIGYGCWDVARLLVERGARVNKLWHAAALGQMNRVRELLAVSPPPSPQDITDAFYQACAGGQRRMAEYLFGLGADLNGTPSWGGNTPLDAADGHGTARQLLIEWLRAQGAKSAKEAC